VVLGPSACRRPDCTCNPLPVRVASATRVVFTGDPVLAGYAVCAPGWSLVPACPSRQWTWLQGPGCEAVDAVAPGTP